MNMFLCSENFTILYNGGSNKHIYEYTITFFQIKKKNSMTFIHLQNHTHTVKFMDVVDEIMMKFN